MRRREFWLFGGAIVTLALDQITKAMVANRLPLWQPWNPVAGLDRIVSLTRITNTGVAFGLFPQAGMLFSIVPVLVVLAILIYYRKMSVGQRLLQVTLGLQLGGALGNLVDRLRLGYVVDFIDFKIWPVFNIADSALVVGTVLLSYHILTEPEPPVRETELSAETGS